MKRRLMALFVVAALMPWPLMIAGDHWWAFVLATVAILVALRLLFESQWRDRPGLKASSTQAVLAVAAFASIAAGSWLLLHHVYEVAALRADAPLLKDQIGFLFQAFNEEIF